MTPRPPSRRALLLVAALVATTCRATTLRFGSDDAVREASCRALADSRVVVAAAALALLGDEPSFQRVRDGVAALGGDFGADDPSATASGPLARLRPLVLAVERDGRLLVEGQAVIARTNAALQAISTQADALLEQSETAMSLELQAGGSAAEIAASGQVVMLSQRLGRSADTLLGPRGVRPESVFLLGKDLRTTAKILDGLADGNSELRLHAARQPALRERLALASATLASMRSRADAVLADLHSLVAAREGQARLQVDMDALGHELALACAQTDAGGRVPLRVSTFAPAPSAPASAPR